MKYMDIAISIHAPARGATAFCQNTTFLEKYFNPRSRTGSDGIWNGIKGAFKPFQSTLPHGERLIKGMNWLIRGLFQSTLPHGERLLSYSEGIDIYIFQSTLPHGERQRNSSHHLRGGNFNPRSRTGSDFVHQALVAAAPISIHAPARGATSLSGSASVSELFQSTLPHGERRRIRSHYQICRNFNPRSRTGSDFHPESGR